MLILSKIAKWYRVVLIIIFGLIQRAKRVPKDKDQLI